MYHTRGAVGECGCGEDELEAEVGAIVAVLGRDFHDICRLCECDIYALCISLTKIAAGLSRIEQSYIVKRCTMLRCLYYLQRNVVANTERQVRGHRYLR